eukprot:gene17426-biopygen6798
MYVDDSLPRAYGAAPAPMVAPPAPPVDTPAPPVDTPARRSFLLWPLVEPAPRGWLPCAPSLARTGPPRRPWSPLRRPRSFFRPDTPSYRHQRDDAPSVVAASRWVAADDRPAAPSILGSGMGNEVSSRGLSLGLGTSQSDG